MLAKMKARRTLPILSHILHGLIAGLFWFKCAWLSAFLFIQFFLYEYFEEKKVKDEMYHEVKEWSLGFVIGLLIYEAVGFFLYFSISNFS